MTTGVDILTEIGGKNCLVIIDSGSCVNAVASGMVTKLRLEIVLHPQTYKVTWVNSMSTDMKKKSYSDSICHIFEENLV